MKPPIPGKIEVHKINSNIFIIERNGIFASTAFTKLELGRLMRKINRTLDEEKLGLYI